MISRKAYWGLLLLLPCLIQLCSSCDAGAKEESKTTIPPSPKFPVPPVEYTDPEVRSNYILDHVFEPYEVLDSSTFITEAVAEQFFVNYFAIAQSASKESRAKSFTEAFNKGSDDFDTELLQYGDQYLYDIGSPIYNEGLYIQLMQVADSLSLLYETDKIILEDRYNMYMKNRVGNKATDFRYISSDGKHKQLFDIKADRILIVFYNPGCGICRDVMHQIDGSAIFSTAIDNGLKVLCISLSDDTETWKAHLSEIPKKAEVGMDEGRTIINQSLYSVRAYPTLYLLDKNKVVILKDPQVSEIEEWLKSNKIK